MERAHDGVILSIRNDIMNSHIFMQIHLLTTSLYFKEK